MELLVMSVRSTTLKGLEYYLSWWKARRAAVTWLPVECSVLAPAEAHDSIPINNYLEKNPLYNLIIFMVPVLNDSAFTRFNKFWKTYGPFKCYETQFLKIIVPASPFFWTPLPSPQTLRITQVSVLPISHNCVLPFYTNKL